jgi:hypothetical protein
LPNLAPASRVDGDRFSDRSDERTDTEPEGMPVPCERCGEVLEQIIHIVEVVVGSPSAVHDRAKGLQAGKSAVVVIRG